MLRILGSAKTLCDRFTRRDLLRAGSLATGAGLVSSLSPQGASADQPQRGGSFGAAKRVILLYLYGAAAQHETFDPKPDAPVEVRGKFRPISTAVPGVQICEHLPRVAKIADRLSIIRSMSHPYNIHSAAYTLTGIDHVDVPMELNPRDARHWPFFGSVLDYLRQQEKPAAAPPPVPRNIALPFRFSSRCPEFQRAGPYSGFLGRTFDPVWSEFEGSATDSVQRWRGGTDQEVEDPYRGISPENRFLVSRAAQLHSGLTLDRLNDRRSLLAQLESARREVDRSGAANSFDRFRQMAYSLIASSEMHKALDVRREPRSARERYGMTLFGQASLVGRRLLEAGATLVTVFWDEIRTANSAWDTHFNHFERLEHELLPGLDRALCALILDLEERGMLDDTLVLCLTEHGRTPKLHEKVRGAGREHWSDVYCNVMAGAGVAGGNVVGASDSNGAFVRERPVSPKDLLWTIYHLLGVDLHQTIPDRLGRPLPLVSGGEVVREVLG